MQNTKLLNSLGLINIGSNKHFLGNNFLNVNGYKHYLYTNKGTPNYKMQKLYFKNPKAFINTYNAKFFVKVKNMQNKIKNNTNPSTTTTVQTLTNSGSGKTGVTNTMLWAFINTHANGNINNVVVVPNPNVVTNPTPNKPATPFGYGGKGNGVRATIQNALLFGTNPTNSNQPFKNVGSALSFASKLGHSAKNPICLLALLNGGYSPSSSTWGVGFITLQVKPTTK